MTNLEMEIDEIYAEINRTEKVIERALKAGLPETSKLVKQAREDIELAKAAAETWSAVVRSLRSAVDSQKTSAGEGPSLVHRKGTTRPDPS